MSMKTIGAAAVVIIAAFIAGVALLGGDDDAQASQSDGAFLAEMAPHHEMAIEMAQIATERAEHQEIKALANDIISTQSEEIETIDQIHQRLFDQPVSQGAHGSLGLDSSMAGMSMDMNMLETAKPFDKAFIDMMITHHQGAIRMARVELEQGADAETMELASEIIDAQSMEIDEMNSWRTEWYGEPSPSGGVPAEDEPGMAGDSMEGMSH